MRLFSSAGSTSGQQFAQAYSMLVTMVQSSSTPHKVVYRDNQYHFRWPILSIRDTSRSIR